MRNYRVQEYSIKEATKTIRAMLEGPLSLAKHLAGRFDIVCREQDGSVAWEEHKPNLFTDYGRRYFMTNTVLTSVMIVNGPSIETPNTLRSSLFDDGVATTSQASPILTPTTDVPTLTKTYSTSFSTPAITRTIGMVGLGGNPTNDIWVSQLGLFNLIAYTLLPTAKTQTTTQTLEVVYKLTLTPVV